MSATRKKNFCPKLYDAGGDLSKKWFWYWNEAGKRRRVYGKMNRSKTVEGRRRAALELLKEIERARVFYENEFQVKELWKAFNSMNGLRPKTLSTYKSKLKSLEEFLKGKSITKESYLEFLNHYAGTHHPATTYMAVNVLNNLFKRAGFNHLIVSDFKTKRGESKPLRYFQPHQARMLAEFLSRHDPELWLWCQFVYFCFLRPRSELRYMRIDDIYFDERKILVRKEVSKNKKTSYVAIPDAFWPDIEKLKSLPPGRFIFPSRKKTGHPIGANTMGRRFKKVLQLHGFSDEYAVYSWKHTGAVALAMAGVSLKEIQLQLRHHSLDMVDRYLRQLGVGDLENLKVKFPPPGGGNKKPGNCRA